MMSEVIAKLRQQRIYKKLTMEELAVKSGVSTKHICNIENEKSTPSVDTLQKLALALGLEIDMKVIEPVEEAKTG